MSVVEWCRQFVDQVKEISLRNSLRSAWDLLLTILSPVFTIPTFSISCWFFFWTSQTLENYWYRDAVGDSISVPFGILTSTLSFILPLQAQAAVNRNKQSLDNYSAFCGDILALGWELLAFARDESTGNVTVQNNRKVEDLFDLLFVLPTIVKLNFRDSRILDLEKLYLVKRKNGMPVTDAKLVMPKYMQRREGTRRNSIVAITKKNQKFLKTNVGDDIKKMQGHMFGMDICEILFAKMYDLIAELETKGDTRKNMLTRTAERIYGSYGNMGNLDSYKLPRMYNYFLFVTLLLFVTLFPFSYGKENGAFILDIIGTNIYWHGIVVIYFFCGIDSVTTTIGNAYVTSSGAVGFQTVGNAESNTNRALHAMYAHKEDLTNPGVNYAVVVDPNTVNTLHRRIYQ